MKRGKGSCNGTFGELVQGVIGERPFLITLPISSLRSEAIFIPDPTVSEIAVLDSKVKALKAGELLVQQFGLKHGGLLDIRSNIPAGKGMASSSADIVAAMKAIAHSYSLPLTKEMISTIAAKIEPTDGVMYDEVVAYDYIQGELMEIFGTLPSFILVGIDLGGEVNTIEFNQFPKAYDRHEQKQFLEAYEWVKEGFRKKDLSCICKAATISARVNQKIVPSPFFNEFEKLAHVCQGGIVVAHSGTVMGILIDRNIPNRNEVVLHLSRQMSVMIKNPTIKPFYYESNEKMNSQKIAEGRIINVL
ncbi:GHMP family kinase ATP-binding protein [Neobacillus ginsengisoli]|uniref:L-threonine kinase n=1 Tax=Neobacillus ginsengisoli TaxID=904295 RepID=A0ABT9Y1X2_9BACI|nr:kinase [Neobacillus ginsengisoli]MDQ0201149.1 L-threonine kinase [Neobacillus ginsengisoli]